MLAKPQLAASLVMLALTFTPMVMANDSLSNGGLRLMPDPMSAPSNNFNAPQVANATTGNEGIALRGSVSAIPKGTIMMIKVDQPVNSASSKVGDPVSAVVESDVFYENRIVVPAGSTVEGMVTSVSPAGHVGKHGAIEVQFSTLKTTYGYSLPLRAHVVTADNTGVIKGDSNQAQVLKTLGSAAGVTAASTLGGTAIGGLVGSVGGGALFGLAAGGLAGIGYAIVREGKEVTIPSGARMSIMLDQPVAVN